MRELAARCGCSASAVRHRLGDKLRATLNRPSPLLLPDNGGFVLVVDALWYYFRKHGLWVLYNMALRPIPGSMAFFLDPLMLEGREHENKLRNAIATISHTIRDRIRAFAADGFRSAGPLAQENGWIYQRCHYHLLAPLQSCLGTRPSTPDKKKRTAIYRLLCTALTTEDRQELAAVLESLHELQAGGVRRATRWPGVIRQFLRDVGAFRAYLDYPDLQLPSTSNTVEAMHGLLRRVTAHVNNPDAVLRRAKAFIRLHPQITCQGTLQQQK